jgi:cell division protein FtsQ
MPLPRPRTLAALVVLIALLAGAWMWVRDSSLVAVRRVTVAGLSGPDAGRIERALVLAGRNMTTLDVKLKELNSAVAPYPLVKSLRVSTQFPHGLRIRVIEQIPVAAVSIGGRSEAVASDGTLLHDAGPLAQLPMIQIDSAPGGTRITGGTGSQLVALLSAAPHRFLSHLSQASHDAAHGLVAQVRGGPVIYFGGSDRLVAKWRAAIAVLSASSSAGAGYVDVTDPVRPAAGALGTGGSATPGASAVPPAASTAVGGG